MKVFRGRKSGVDCVVELDNDSYTTQLSLENSLQVVDHSPDGFQWGYQGSGPSQLAAAILNEVTEDLEITREYYELFKLNHVSRWADEFEINEVQVRDWLRSVGAVQASVIDKAKKEFKAFGQLYERAKHEADIASKSERHSLRAMKLYEVAIPLSFHWVQKYNPYVMGLNPAQYGFTNETFEWLPLLEEIMIYWLPQFQQFVRSQEIEHPMLEGVEHTIAEINELLANHIYPPKV